VQKSTTVNSQSCFSLDVRCHRLHRLQSQCTEEGKFQKSTHDFHYGPGWRIVIAKPRNCDKALSAYLVELFTSCIVIVMIWLPLDSIIRSWRQEV